MKLAFVLFKYFPFGGMQRDFFRILNVCLQRGHEVEVFTQSWQGDIPTGVNIHIVKSPRWTNHGKAKYFSQQIESLLKIGSFDKVIGFNKMPGLDWYYCADTCFVANSAEKHHKWYNLSSRFKTYSKLERAVFDANHSTKILLLSAAEQHRYASCYHTQHERFYLLPPGIDKSRQRPIDVKISQQRIRAELKLNDSHNLLLFVGSGFKTKGLDRVLHGIAALPDEIKSSTKLAVIGQDNQKAFKRLIKKLALDDHVLFLGGRHDVADFLWSADLLVHPAYRENTGTVLLEALVAGLPVLTTSNCGYANYIIEANAGIVLPNPFKQNQFNATLIAMISDVSQRKMWRNNALKFAEHADIYHLPERAMDLIETVGSSHA